MLRSLTVNRCLGGAALCGAALLPCFVWAGGLAATVCAVLLAGALSGAFMAERRERRECLDAQSRLKESARHAEDIIAAIPSGLIGLDAKGRICRWNEGATKILGVAREQAMGREASDWPQAGQAGLGAMLTSALAGELTRRGTLEVTRSDGTSIPLGVSTSRLGSDGGAAGAVAVF